LRLDLGIKRGLLKQNSKKEREQSWTKKKYGRKEGREGGREGVYLFVLLKKKSRENLNI
jgi:hypothetical protein